MPRDPKLIPLMQEVADFTRPECARCPEPFSCCEAMYCEIARYHAKEYWNVDLVDTGHATLPFMGEEGCVVAPHLRPMCTMHTCRFHREGTSGDPEWDRKFVKLKDRVEQLERASA